MLEAERLTVPLKPFWLDTKKVALTWDPAFTVTDCGGPMEKSETRIGIKRDAEKAGDADETVIVMFAFPFVVLVTWTLVEFDPPALSFRDVDARVGDAHDRQELDADSVTVPL